MGRSSIERTGLALLLAALLGSCAAPMQQDAEPPPAGVPRARIAERPKPPARPSPAERAPAKPSLRGRVTLPSGTTLSVDASTDGGQGSLSFELRDGDIVDILRSEIRLDGGVETSYCEVRGSAGRGWIRESALQDIRWHSADEVAALARDAPRVAAREPLRIDVQHEEVVEAEEFESPQPAARTAQDVPDVLSVKPAGSGKAFDSSALIVRGQYTIIDFFSEHCGPCREMAPRLEAYAKKHPRIVLRKVDVDRPGATRIDWASPIVQQYGISSLPYVELYDTDGTLLGTGDVALTRLAELSRQR